MQDKTQYEIDIVAGNKDALLFCECKWRNEPVKKNVLEALKRKSQNIGANHSYYALFSKTGFGEWEDSDVLRFTPVDMF